MNLDFGTNHHLVYRSDGLSSPSEYLVRHMVRDFSCLVTVGFRTDASTAPENPSGQVLDFAISEPTVPPSAGCPA